MNFIYVVSYGWASHAGSVVHCVYRRPGNEAVAVRIRLCPKTESGKEAVRSLYHELQLHLVRE